MISPLDAFSALTQMAAPASTGAALPAGATSGAGQTFQIPNMGGTQSPTGISEGFNVSPVSVSGVSAPASSGIHGPTTWGHMAQQMVMDVNSKQQNATAMVNDVLKGGPTPVHEAMIATEEASLSFELVAEMRNKVVDAYNQVMQMQV